MSAEELELPRCRECGGFGRGLVANPQRLCMHCARRTKAFFDPESSVFTREQGFVDISPKADGGVLKKVLREGEPEARHVEEGCPTFVQYVGRLLDGSIFDTSRDMVDGKHAGGTDDPFEFQLGREKVIKGWDIGVATMARGEIARFIIAPEYAYGSKGFAPKVEPDETLDFEIELLRFKDPLPRFPTQAELAESRRKQHEEEQKMLEENPPPTIGAVDTCVDSMDRSGKLIVVVDERVASALEEKDKGNELVKTKDYDAAQKCYDSGFVHIFFAKDEWEQLVPAADKEKVNAVKRVLYLNRALCKLKLGKIDDAEWDCDQAILLDKENSKAHFRRSLVFLEKLKAELAKEQRGDFWILDKGFEFSKEAESSLAKASQLLGDRTDAQVTRTAAELKRAHAQLLACAARYKEDEKKLYREKMFARLEAKNKALEESEKRRVEREVFDDMPALE